MLENLIEQYLPPLIHILEIMGIFILVVGAVGAFYHYCKNIFFQDTFRVKFHFANTMAMALEFKLAAEILKTVIVRSWHELVMLGAIVILRILMTVIIQWEIKSEENTKVI
ncbi:MAG: hypothetical protein ATN36_06290 [Epulopiscium sp. Nele67-Bin005]|nr:MAG: hypothetical protein ATN36_06290 [Epulopiscium sp. Nele67-Bin005]